jgi:hypothetical protein
MSSSIYNCNLKELHLNARPLEAPVIVSGMNTPIFYEKEA